MIKLHKIDADGFLIVGQDMYVDVVNDELQNGYTDVILDTSERGYFRPQLVGGEWIEGATQAEIDEIVIVSDIIISPEQRIAELEQKIAQFEQMLATR